MKNLQVLILLFVSTLFTACVELPPPPPPDSDDVLQVRDSIRMEIVLRISNAKQEINRRAEMMRRRAYSEDETTAARLRKTAAEMEEAYLKLDVWIDSLESDSLLHDWNVQRQEIDKYLEELGYTLKIIL